MVGPGTVTFGTLARSFLLPPVLEAPPLSFFQDPSPDDGGSGAGWATIKVPPGKPGQTLRPSGYSAVPPATPGG